MTSKIDAIYDALAAVAITLDSKTIAVKDADELPNSVAAANLPVRLLTPLEAFGDNAGVRSSIIGTTAGSQPTVAFWTILDLMLWAPVVSNVGVKAHGKIMVNYCAAYLDAMKLIANSYNLVSVSVAPSIIRYPEGSNRWFYGARATIEIKEDFV